MQREARECKIRLLIEKDIQKKIFWGNLEYFACEVFDDMEYGRAELMTYERGR